MENTSTTRDRHPDPALGSATPKRAEHARLTDMGELHEALRNLFESAELFSRHANGFLTRQAEERPQALLACAAGLGFVVGGGLASRAGAMLVRASGRLALAYFLHHASKATR